MDPLAVLAVLVPSLVPAASEPVSVELALSTDPTLQVQVSVTVEGHASGRSRFALAHEWGGVGPDREDLTALAATDAEEAALPIEANGPQAWLVTHAPGATIRLTATLQANRLRDVFQGSQHYRPILEADLFHTAGHLFLPLPDDRDWESRRQVRVSWKGFEEVGWRTITSFGAGEDVAATASLAELRDALFVAGPIPVVERDLPGGKLLVSVDANRWSFEPDAFADLVAAIVAVEREAMDDQEAGSYWVHALAVGPPLERGHQFGGTGLKDAFTLFLQPNVDLSPTSEAHVPVLMLLAHEAFHAWVGKQIRSELPEGAHKWFFEGFVEHMARRLLRDGGFLTDEDFARDLNRVLLEYHTSPARTISAADMGERYWSDGTVQRMGYLRGDVVAMALDHALRNASDGMETVTDWMRALREESLETGSRFDTEGLLTRIAARVDADVHERLRRVVVEGEILALEPDTFGPGFRVELEAREPYDPGFDVRASIAAMRVLGLRADSRAATAGLVEGAQIRGLSIETGRTDREAEVTIQTEGGERTVRYLPVGEPIELPVVRVR